MRWTTSLPGIVVCALVLWSASPCRSAETKPRDASVVSIVVGEKATVTERLAAEELAGYLGRRYQGTGFETTSEASSSERSIYLGTPESLPRLKRHFTQDKLHGPESYLVTTAAIEGKPCGLIIGHDPAGVMYGVYGLLEKLGWGFFLSFETKPEPKAEPFRFDSWDLSNHPTTGVRAVFNWHNFLSGCTGWDLPQWKQWVARSQKMGFNTVIVHAYGNNPMFRFTFEGVTKPVGFIATTRKGRDWSTNHVNDVRRLHGGFLFDSPVFGSQVGQVSDEQRVDATRALMQRVFAYAGQRGMKVNFALDFDLPSSNPQEMIRKLPEADRFEVGYNGWMWDRKKLGNFWLARPDTPGGYEFYKVQAKALFDAYPRIDTVTLWRRYNKSIWPSLRLKELPAPWQEEYRKHIAAKPHVAKMFQSVGEFAMSKVVAAWRRALDELGHGDVRLAMGSWRLPWLPAAAEFLPQDVTLIPLDSEVARGDDNLRNKELMSDVLAGISKGRLIPVIWAQHDDGEYVGAPLRTYSRFSGKLDEWDASGFGIIHWMTHPLDLYFISHIRQTWAKSEDESLEETCLWMARRCFGRENEQVMSEYLRRWAREMPFFGRETTDFFIDRPLSDFAPVKETIAGCERRLELLRQANPRAMTVSQRRRREYFLGYERFVANLFQTQQRHEQAVAAHKNGDLREARRLITLCHPETVIEQYARTVDSGDVSRGEQGLVVTMNTRWLSHYVRFRQQLGLEPVRYNYAETRQEPLAQNEGAFTFYFDREKNLWQVFGEHETGAETFTLPEDTNIELSDSAAGTVAEVFRTGLVSNEPLRLTLRPIMPHGSRKRVKPVPLVAGKYLLTLWMVEPSATGPEQRVFEVRINSEVEGSKGSQVAHEKADAEPQLDRVDLFKRAGGRKRAVAISYPVTLTSPGAVTVTLTPIRGQALICGAVLRPTSDTR